ncbi:class I SAM-dependent methyltransferase (plasmid) [Methylocystis echinoides]
MQLVEGKVEALPFPYATFDRVLAVTALCFIADAERAIAEMARVLKPGGLFTMGNSATAAYGPPIAACVGGLAIPYGLRRFFAQAPSFAGSWAKRDSMCSRYAGPSIIPPCEAAARLLAPVDPWLGRWTKLGAAFIVLSAAKPPLRPQLGEASASLRRETPSLEPPRPNSLNFYERWILPPLLDWTMQQRNLKNADAEWLLPCAAARSKSASVQG